MKTSGCRKSPSAHMQARGDKEGRDAVEGGEDMKSTKRFKAALAAVLVLALSPLFGGAAFAEDSSATTYSGNKTAVTDPSTIWDWQGLVENDTSSVGRIWTDKTVSDNEISKNGITVSKENGADFLTALTALSSTSNLSNTATTPLDIVLVLDASGSMDDPMGGGDKTKRIDALKNAANSFIDEIANQNATVKDAAKQHQVAIVKFAGDKTDKVGNDTYYAKGYRYNYSQVMKKLAPCTNDTKGDFSSQVNAIKPAGATNAAAGLELAKGQTSGRSDAKKVVIFFTDGTPTTQSSFSPSVASDAVGYAEKMKDAGAAVYSIGIFQGAHPDIDPVSDSTSNENKFMHAVSSNYPSATYSYKKTSGKYEWNFGDRAKGSDGKDATFYKSATNADELRHVFDDISKEISKGSGYPTKTTEGFEHETGYITFDDQLGDYMQVTDLSKLVYNGTVYGCKSKTTGGNVDTYHFSGDVHSGLAAADLKDVVITVTRSDDAAVGDKVQVKVPASLIPLRNFAIDLAKDTMSVSDTTPISVLYSSGVKPAALDLLENPDDAMKEYMANNTDAAGKVNFYANKWSGEKTGDAVATFQPATGNSYYYFTQDTYIYTDEACTTPAKSVKSGSTYYYKHNYYAMENGKPVAKTEHVSFPGDAAEQAEGAIAWDSAGACYLKSGTPRLTYVNELHKVKEENRTATAADVLNPKWSGIEQSAAQTLINAYLGNNGKLSVEVPGTLTVTKQLALPVGYSADDFANESFEFTIAMQDAVGKNFNAVVKNANGEQQGDKFVLAFGQDGQAKHSLKPGETLYVYGLSAGWDYKVSETPRTGFTAEAVGAEGKIAAGETSAVTYTNTYAASGTLDGETYLKGEKVLTGRAWLETDKFTFILKDADTSVEAPMPPTGTLGDSKGETHVEVTQPLGTPAGTEVPFNFQDISYTKPGTYTYKIWESEELSTLNPGVSASQALYQVVVTVTDESHNGTLTVKSKMTKLFDDDGVKCEELIEGNTAKFENEYKTSEVKWTPSGTKTYTDTTGGNPLKPDMFHVIVCTNNAKAPLPEGEGVTRVDRGEWRGVLTTVEAGGSIAWPSAKYEHKDLDPETLDATFEYKIVEVVKVGDTWRAVNDPQASGSGLPGMGYDKTVWTAKVTIKDVGGVLELSVKYYENDSEEPITGSMFSFDNTYKPDPAKLEGDTVITGTKMLTGRDMAEGETFGFKLSAADEATQKAVDAGNIVIPKGADEAEVSGAKADVEKEFSFGEMTFSKPGTYSFAVQESKYCGNDLDAAGAATGGIVFDRHVHKVTVKVTDGHGGKLVAEVSYDNGPANFVNKYEQNAQFPGITVQKTMNGRDMAADEFSFSIHGVDKEGAVAAAEAEKRLADSDRSFTNAARADGVACDMAKMSGVAFTQADIGKTFAYEVREVVPADVKPGVSYDDSVHTLEITVGMSGDADKHLTLTTKLDGEVIDLATKPVAVAFTNGYQATPTSYDTATAGLNKVLEGRNWTDADNFTFELKALDGGPLPKDAAGNDVTNVTVSKANAESFGFGTIEFTSDMVKAESDHKRTFTYEVREVVPADGHKQPGIHYDDNVATIKVTVSDDGSGMLKASAVAENIRFVNRYAAEIDYTAAGGLNVAKTLTGRDMAEGQFTIKVTPGDEASAYALGLPLEGAEIAMPAAADGAQAVKSALGEQHVVLRQSDVGKTYTYKVVEVQATADGYTYDTTEYAVTVMAWDDPQKAALTVTTEVAGPKGIKTYVYGADPSAAGTGPAVVPFANTYAASTDNPGGTAAQVTATKELTGRPLSADEFTFAVKYATGGDDLRTAKNAADGTVTFDALHYTTEMLEGLVKDGNASKTSDKGVTSWTVSYLAYEKTDGLAGQGITAQTQPIPLKVTVVDNGDGSLTATANLDKGLKFENTYSTGDPVQVGLSGVKTLQAASGLDPASIEDKFTFTVTSDDAAAPMPERTTAKNAADGSVDFGTIKFTLDDLNRALGVNDQTAAAGADKAEADAAKAAEQAAVPAKEADADAAKAADADASKAAADADKVAAGADNASAQAADGGDKPAAGGGQGAGAVAAPDAANGTVDEVVPGNQPADQPANPEPESGKPRSHVFTYKVTESGSVPGVTNDAAATKTVSFKVTDDGNGKLTVERQGDAATPAFSFANTYTVEPASSSVTDQVTVTKTLTGRDMAAGEFAFELLEGEDVVATGANAADGSVTLSAVKYTQPGTHRYTLHEVGGGAVANGVTYDGATYTVVTTVKDNGNGTLSVIYALEGAREATFANAYQATSTTVIIGATKTLVGKNLENGQFTFVLTAADGTELKAKNAADGKIAFPALTFDKPGTYEFALTELDDAQANVTYDKRAYKVTVTVVDDGLGHLNATVAGDADVLAFTNTYAEPPAPVQPTQPGGKTFTPRGPIGKVLTQTGDDKLALVLPLAAVALAGAASIAALLIMRRRDKR